MGHGKKNQSRHSQIVVNNERIGKLGKALAAMVEISKKEETERGERIVAVDDSIGAILTRVAMLEATLEFNALPFWTRWSRTWKAAREATKDSMKPQLMPLDLDVAGEAAELPKKFVDAMVAGKPEDRLSLVPRPAGESNRTISSEPGDSSVDAATAALNANPPSDHDAAAAADRQHDAEREATLAGEGEVDSV